MDGFDIGYKRKC